MRWLLLLVAALAARVVLHFHLPVSLSVVTAFWYGNSLLGQYSATAARRIDWVTDTIKTSLHTSTYTPNQDTHTFYSDLTNELGAGSGYSTGGTTLGTKSVSYDATSNETRLIAANAAWTTATFTCRYSATYKDTGTGTTSPLMGYVNFGGDQSVSSGTFTIQWDATGVLKITAA